MTKYRVVFRAHTSGAVRFVRGSGQLPGISSITLQASIDLDYEVVNDSKTVNEMKEALRLVWGLGSIDQILTTVTTVKERPAGKLVGKVRVRDLRDQNGPETEIIYCPLCGAENSAHLGDYFNFKTDHVRMRRQTANATSNQTHRRSTGSQSVTAMYYIEQENSLLGTSNSWTKSPYSTIASEKGATSGNRVVTKRVPSDDEDEGDKCFIAHEGGGYTCEDCWTPEQRASAGDDDVEVWREHTDGWTAPVVCKVCKLSIPVYVDGEVDKPFEVSKVIYHQNGTDKIAHPKSECTSRGCKS